jgi:hypothetical protein
MAQQMMLSVPNCHFQTTMMREGIITKNISPSKMYLLVPRSNPGHAWDV